MSSYFNFIKKELFFHDVYSTGFKTYLCCNTKHKFNFFSEPFESLNYQSKN